MNAGAGTGAFHFNNISSSEKRLVIFFSANSSIKIMWYRFQSDKISELYRYFDLSTSFRWMRLTWIHPAGLILRGYLGPAFFFLLHAKAEEVIVYVKDTFGDVLKLILAQIYQRSPIQQLAPRSSTTFMIMIYIPSCEVIIGIGQQASVHPSRVPSPLWTRSNQAILERPSNFYISSARSWDYNCL